MTVELPDAATLKAMGETILIAGQRAADPPMMPVVRLHEPTFGKDEIAAAVAVLQSTRVTQGAKVREFEHRFWPAGHAVACNSGSSANLLAIAGLVSTGMLEPGDEVIVSALSWSTTVWPLVQHGLVPVFVDCDPLTLNIDPSMVERAIGPKTRAIMPVHVYGNPCNMAVMGSIVDRAGIGLIEDCCEALGAEFQEEPVGSFGHAATFSFYFSHHITTLEGGIVVTQNDALDDTLRIQRSHGWVRDVANPQKYTEAHPDIDPNFLFVDLGYNLRMTELQAAIGLVQLPKLAPIVEHRRKMHRLYRTKLAGAPHLRFQLETPGGDSSCFGFTIVLDGFPRADLTRALNAGGVETRPIICGNLAAQPGMQKHKHRVVGELRNATNVMRNGFSVGCHQDVTEADVDHVVSIIQAVLCGR